MLVDGMGQPTISDKPARVMQAINRIQHWSQLKRLLIHPLQPQVLFLAPRITQKQVSW